MSDGLSDYWADKFRRVSPRSAPIVPRYDLSETRPDIDADAAIVWVNPPPFYFWLGRDAE